MNSVKILFSIRALAVSAVLFPFWPSTGTCSESSAPTLLFDNLRAFGLRLDVGDPSLNRTNQYGQKLEGPKAIDVADLNGDERPDLAVANKDGSVTVNFGNGDGSFGPSMHLDTGTVELRGIVCSDLTGNGHRDIAVGAPFAGHVFLFVNTGGGVFDPVTTIPAWVGARDLAAGDFDGDGLNDLAVAGTTNGVAHYRNMGGGTFEVKTNLTALASKDDDDLPQPAFYLKTFRYPGETKDELVAARAQKRKVWTLSTDAAGCLAIQGTLTNVGVNALDVGPLLRPATNSVPDLIVSHNQRGILEIHSAISTVSRFNQVTNQQIAISGGPRNVRIVDLDGDHWNDLVVVQQNFSKVTTYRNLEGVFVPTAESTVGAKPREMALGDFNGDDYPDVAVLNRFSFDVSILTTFPGVVGFTVPDSVYAVDGGVSGLEVRDFNDDSLDDVIQLHGASGELSVRLSTNGMLTEPTFFGLGLRPIGQVIADVNKDDIPDVVTADFSPFVTVRLGTGDGDFGPPQDFHLPHAVPTSGLEPGVILPAGEDAQLFSVEAADFDNDGCKDLAVGFWDCRLGFYRGHGDGTFTFTRAHMLFREPRGQTAGDFDQDGDMDLVSASLYNQLAVIENLGDLLTTIEITKTILETGVRNTSAIKAYHYDEDNDPDLLLVGQGGANLFLGGPGVSFIESTNSVGLPNLPASSVATGDFDGDGDSDMATSCDQFSCVTVFLQDTNGVYIPELTVDVPAARFLASGDIDGDGLADLVGSGEALWIALSGTAAQPGPPPPLPGTRAVEDEVVINEVLASNTELELAEDGGRTPDWIELYNGRNAPMDLTGWRLELVRTDETGITSTNQFILPNDQPIEPDSHQLIFCSNNLRSPWHTGFPLPAEGGLLCLYNAEGIEVSRVVYPDQQENISHSRFRDGMRSFIACNFPTPSRSNVDGGPVLPDLDFKGIDYSLLKSGGPIRFFARATDDVGVMGVVVVWRRLDITDDVNHELILGDDGMSGDGGFLDGLFSGVLEGLPDGAEIQFYLECLDVGDQVVTSPGNPVFARAGQEIAMHSLLVGEWSFPLEISEIVSDNQNGLVDEGGGTPDWIEIRNCSTAPMPLDRLTLAPRFFGNSNERLDFGDDLILNPGENLIVFADNNSSQGPLHAAFKVNKDGDQLFLRGTTINGSRFLIDMVTFDRQTTDTAWARLGCGGPWRQTSPTPYEDNVEGTWATLLGNDGTFTFGFPTAIGSSYVVEYKDAIDSSTWNSLPPMTGNGLEQSVTLPKVAQRFYRVQVE